MDFWADLTQHERSVFLLAIGLSCFVFAVILLALTMMEAYCARRPKNVLPDDDQKYISLTGVPRAKNGQFQKRNP